MLRIKATIAVLMSVRARITCGTATNAEEATQLIENGFDYITEIDGLKLFRKRK